MGADRGGWPLKRPPLAASAIEERQRIRLALRLELDATFDAFHDSTDVKGVIRELYACIDRVCPEGS